MTKTSTIVPSERAHDIDWLRIGTVFLLIPFHSARVFDIWDPFYAKNAQTSIGLSWLIAFLNQWMMPLLFVLAGAASWHALKHRSSFQYLKERIVRLLIPFIFGMIIIVPPQAYIARLKNPSYHQTYWQFLLGYFKIVPQDLSGYFGAFTPGHLWFILFLVVFSVIALPVFQWLRGERGRSFISWLAGKLQNSGGIFLFFIPLLLTELLPEIGGKNPGGDLVLLIIGFIIAADQRFRHSIERHRSVASATAILGTIVIFTLNPWANSFPDLSAVDILFSTLIRLTNWGWVLALMGFGSRYLNVSSKVLLYANEASYPFYILHQTVIVAIAHFVAGCSYGIAAKYIIICVASLAGTLLIYELLIRRINALRYFFGMKTKPKTSAAIISIM